jgi:hypothetical protein
MRPVTLLVSSALSLGNGSPNTISVLQVTLSSILIDNTLLAQHRPRLGKQYTGHEPMAWKMPFADFVLERRVPFNVQPRRSAARIDAKTGEAVDLIDGAIVLMAALAAGRLEQRAGRDQYHITERHAG